MVGSILHKSNDSNWSLNCEWGKQVPVSEKEKMTSSPDPFSLNLGELEDWSGKNGVDMSTPVHPVAPPLDVL